MKSLDIVQNLQDIVTAQSNLNVELERDIKSLKEFNLMHHMQQSHLQISEKTANKIEQASASQLSKWVRDMEAWEAAGMPMGDGL